MRLMKKNCSFSWWGGWHATKSNGCLFKRGCEVGKQKQVNQAGNRLWPVIPCNSSTQRRVSHTAQKYWRSSEFLGLCPGRGIAWMPRFHLQVLVADLGFTATLALERNQVADEHTTIKYNKYNSYMAKSATKAWDPLHHWQVGDQFCGPDPLIRESSSPLSITQT